MLPVLLSDKKIQKIKADKGAKVSWLSDALARMRGIIDALFSFVKLFFGTGAKIAVRRD